jgi:hypothetical protein
LRNHILIIALLITSTLVFSQPSNTGNWLMYFGNQKINNKWNWHNEVQYRNYNLVGDLQQLLLRTGVGYNLTENNNNILLGYGYIHSQNYTNSTSKTQSNEHRLFQQFITRQNFKRVFMQHRYRIEERFLQANFQVRFRYFMGLNVPINKPTMQPKAIYASMYNEIFLNAQSAIFDRNRLYGALGFVYNKNTKIEVGFMAQSLENKSRNQFQLAIFNNLALAKN